MKRLLIAVLALLPSLVLAAGGDLFINQRNADNTATLTRSVTKPAGNADGVFGFSGANQIPAFLSIGPGLNLSGGILDAVPASVTWANVTAKPTTVSGYGITDAFSGAYAALSGVPVSFPPSAHAHAAADVTSGTLAIARIPALPISQTTGLQTVLDSKFSTPAGTTSQYVNGAGTLTAFPQLFNGAYASLTGIPATFAPTAHTQAFSTITATPTTLAGYGITDAASVGALAGYATTSALTSGLAGKFSAPTGTTAQYIRGDGSLATLPTTRRIEVYPGTTNAAGQVVVTYPAAYPVVPIVQPPAPALASQVWTTVSSTTTGFTLQLNQRNSINLLNADVLLGATVPVSGSLALFLVVAQ